MKRFLKMIGKAPVSVLLDQNCAINITVKEFSLMSNKRLYICPITSNILKKVIVIQDYLLLCSYFIFREYICVVFLHLKKYQLLF